MANLLEETVATLKVYGKTLDDINWLGSSDGKYALISQDDIRQALCVEYDDGYGAPKIATDLVIVGDGWWLERHEYDGSEWWEYKQAPTTTAHALPLRQVIVTENQIGWESVESIHEDLENPDEE